MFAGYVATVAVFGYKFSYEAKQSKKTLCIFEVGKLPQPVFHILVYDLAYINVPCMRIQSDNEFKSEFDLLKASLAEKEGLLCPNKVITTIKDVVCD